MTDERGVRDQSAARGHRQPERVHASAVRSRASPGSSVSGAAASAPRCDRDPAGFNAPTGRRRPMLRRARASRRIGLRRCVCRARQDHSATLGRGIRCRSERGGSLGWGHRSDRRHASPRVAPWRIEICPALWPIVTITSARRSTSSVTGRANSSSGSRPSSAIAVRTCGSSGCAGSRKGAMTSGPSRDQTGGQKGGADNKRYPGEEYEHESEIPKPAAANQHEHDPNDQQHPCSHRKGWRRLG